MHILYLTAYRLPTEKAHGRQVANMCDAMIQLGHTVTIIAPYRFNTIQKSFSEYYDVSPKIIVEKMTNIDWLQYTLLPAVISFKLMLQAFKLKIKRYVRSVEANCIYLRDYYLIACIPKTYTAIILELHSIPKSNKKTFVRLCNRCQKIVCLTHIMAQNLKHMGVHVPIIVEPDAVDIDAYTVPYTKAEALASLQIQTNKTIVSYTGKLKTMGMDKGVSDLLKALSLLKNTNQFYGLIVGGSESDKNEYALQARVLGLTADDILFTGEVSHADVPMYLAASDILAMPWPNKEHYRSNMSPLKMFEYMAAKRPILTGDLPTIREVLDESMAVFCKPDSPASIAEKLQSITSNVQYTENITAAAYNKVQYFTWKKRAERIFV